MSISQTFPFTDSVNYVRSNTEIAAGKAKLSLVSNPGQVFSQAFTADTGFTYDAAKAEFVGGVLRQKDLRPANSIVGATFTTSKDLSWSQGGALTATDVGTALSSGKLEVIGNNISARYTNAEIGAVASQFALKFKFIPKFNGSPLPGADIIGIKPVSGNANRFGIFLSQGAGWRVVVFDSAGVSAFEADTATVAFNLDQEYEMEINVDTEAGKVYTLRDGVLMSTATFTGFTRGVTATTLCLGDWDYGNYSNHQFDDVVLFSGDEHSNSNYTPGYSLSEVAFAASSVALPAFTYTGIGTILAVEGSAVTEAGAPRYIIAGKYWNGSAWVTSNGSYAQANTSADVIANLTSLTVTGATSFVVSVVFTDGATVSSVDSVSVTVTGQKYSPTGYIEPAQAIQVKALIDYSQVVTTPGSTAVKVILKIDGVLKWFDAGVLSASDGTAAQANTAAELAAGFASLDLGSNSSVLLRWLLTTPTNTDTPELDEATIEYNFGALETDPATCEVYGYVRKIDGSPIAGASVSFKLSMTTKQYKEANMNSLLDIPVVVTTDDDGYFSTLLIRTSEFEGTGKYEVTITKDSVEASLISKKKLIFEVPDADQKDLTDLLTAV